MKWISTKKEDLIPNERWLFIPKYGKLKVINSEPLIFRSEINSSRLTYWDKAFRRRLFEENRVTFHSVDRYLRNKLLRQHKHCINQFGE